jgi:hypothetical protein
MTRDKALILAGFTIWPFIFPLVGLLAELMGIIPINSSDIPWTFIAFLGLLCFTVIEILALLVFYINFLFFKTTLPIEHKLIWTIALFIGHVVVMPVFWYLFVWKPRTYPPLKIDAKFSLVVFVPLLLMLLSPLIFLIPLALLFTPVTVLGEFPKGLTLLAIQWIWILAPLLGALTIYWIGKWTYHPFINLPSHLVAWLILWVIFSLLSLPVIWFDLTVLSEMVPTDANPNSLVAMLRFAILGVIFLQPLIVGWLYIVSRILRKLFPTAIVPVAILSP